MGIENTTAKFLPLRNKEVCANYSGATKYITDNLSSLQDGRIALVRYYDASNKVKTLVVTGNISGSPSIVGGDDEKGYITGFTVNEQSGTTGVTINGSQIEVGDGDSTNIATRLNELQNTINTKIKNISSGNGITVTSVSGDNYSKTIAVKLKASDSGLVVDTDGLSIASSGVTTNKLANDLVIDCGTYY